MRYRSATKTVFSAKYHIVWCPKDGRRVLVGAVATRLVEIIREVCDQLGADVLEVEAMPDHVHLLAEVPPAVALSRLVAGAEGPL